MLNHHEIYDLFARLDAEPALWTPRLGAWRAWPMVKMQLLWRLMSAHPAGIAPGSTTPLAGKIANRVAALVPTLGLALHNRSAGRGAPVVLMIARYGEGDAPERPVDRYFGALEDDAFAFPFDVLQFPKEDNGTSRPGRETIRSLAPTQVLAEQLALFLMLRPVVRRPADALAEALIAAGLPLPDRSIHRHARLALGLFEARRRLFGRLFARLAPRVAILTYAPGRMGEVAAARERGVHVIELQHGMFGPACPDYSWPAQARDWRDQLALPDTVAVFGPFFREALLAGGFWRDDEVCVAGAARMDDFTLRPNGSPDPNAPFELLFLAQPLVAHAASAFLGETLKALSVEGRRDIRLALKPHHRDADGGATYRALAQGYPDLASVLPKDADSFEAMARADAVASYNSLGLAEAAAIGTPPISICGGATPGGFARSFDGDDLRAAIPHVAAPDELIATLDALRTQAIDAGPRAELGRRFFATGFVENLSRLVASRLDGSNGPGP